MPSLQPKIREISVDTPNGMDQFGLVWLEQLWRWSTLTSLVISVSRTEMSLSVYKIVVPSTALLYPAYKNKTQMHGGLGQVCATRMYHSIGHMKFLKFQTRIFVEWKALKPFHCNFYNKWQKLINPKQEIIPTRKKTRKIR